jgi:hypothetical protein
MTISEYACELCEYRYEGCGGVGVTESGAAWQTVSCAECRALHDVGLGANLRHRPRGMTMEDVLAGPRFACPVDAAHPVRPWTDGEPRMAVPGAVEGPCPRCESRMRPVRVIREID